MKKTKSGFSLIELLIVLSIILIVASIAIPNLLRSKLAANEASAVGSLRTMVTAQATYSSDYSNGFAPNLGALGGPSSSTLATCDHALLIDSLLSNNGSGNASSKSGYSFAYAPGPSTGASSSGCSAQGAVSFQITAIPQVIGATGQRGFFTDESGVIRFTADGSVPVVGSPPVQ
ncbi:MAG: prepilin-type N-terminal cleavage/methylation domain-containing protein [Candidatus Acidiferrales bacterium]